MVSWRVCIVRILPVLLLCMSRLTDAALKIVPLAVTFNVAEHGSATVTCTNLAVGGSQPDWEEPNEGQIIGPHGGGGSLEKYVSYHTEPDTGHKVTRLHLDNVIKDWSGGYACLADGETKGININVYKPVTLTNELAEKSQFLVFGEPGIISCTMDGEIDTVVSWFGPIGAITSVKGGRYLITPMESLVIHNVTLEDGGTYRCSGSVPDVGEGKVLVIETRVYVMPKIRYPPISKNATELTSAFFTCEAIGEPQPTYIWYDGTVELNDPDKYVLSDNGKILTILNLVKDDQKRYTCVVRNPAGEDRRDGELTVDIPPTPSNAITLDREERTNVKFFCDIKRGDRENLVLAWKRYEKWLPNGVQVDSRVVIKAEDGTGQNPGSLGSISLSITDIHRGDEGDYTCFARNNGGYGISHNVLRVRYAPVINLDYTPNKVYSWIGREQNLTCFWFGYPIPKLFWYVNGRPLVAPSEVFAGNATIHDFKNGTTSLFIETTENDFRPYQCEGRNFYGRATHRIEFVRAYAMRKPRNAQALSASATTIEISFDNPIEVGADYPEYLKILGYIIGYNEYKQSTEMYKIIKNRCTSDEFQCGRLCIEKERRCDGFMDCLDNSDEENCDPEGDCPGGFKCPIRNGKTNPCLPISYVCDHLSDCVDGADETEESCNTYFRPLFFDTRVTGLAPNRLYQFRVAVINEVGWGEWSFNSTERTLDYGPPSQPMIFKRAPERDTIYEVVWLEPYDSGGSPIISYELTYAEVKSGDVTELGRDPVTVPASKNSDSAPVFRHTLTNLKPGTFYFLELRAQSTWGKSEPGTLNFRLPGGAPNPIPTLEPRGTDPRIGELTIAAFIGIMVGGFLLILILLDCLCYCTNSCGLTMCVCVHLCGKQSPEAKEEMEAVEYGMSTVGGRMKMERLAEVDMESNVMSDGASQYASMHPSRMADDRWKMPSHATYEADQLLQGTTYPITDLAVTTQPVYGNLNPSTVSSIYGPSMAKANSSCGEYMYTPSEPTYANPESMFRNSAPSYRNEKLGLERDLKTIFS